MISILIGGAGLIATSATLAADTASIACEHCNEWNAPQPPFRVFGNTWYVGVKGLSSILVTSAQGHVLLDAALPQSAPLIAANVRALGFKVEDIKLIVNSHAHYDHAGGIAELARLSGAEVAVSPFTAQRFKDGNPDDAQFGKQPAFPAVSRVREIGDGEVQRVGELALTAHFTPGHTSGATSWTWRSCEDGRCVDVVYADSLTAPGFKLLGNPRQPDVVPEFERSFAAVAALPCEVLITPHPDASSLYERLVAREGGKAEAMIDRDACRDYAQAARKRFQEQLAAERKRHKT